MLRIAVLVAVLAGCGGVPGLPDRASPELVQVDMPTGSIVMAEATNEDEFPWLRDFMDEDDSNLLVLANVIDVVAGTFVIVNRSYTTSDRDCGSSDDPNTICLWWDEIVVMNDVDGIATEVGHLSHYYGGVDGGPATGLGLDVEGELRIEERVPARTELWYRLGP